jgi:hypothetical protein
MVNRKLERMWKVALVACFNVITYDYPGEAEENHENPQSRSSVSLQGFETGISAVHVTSICRVIQVSWRTFLVVSLSPSIPVPGWTKSVPFQILHSS